MSTEPNATETETPAPDYIGTATYSPEDNKIRITPFSRLPKPLYERVRAAGFIWAPKQELFVAPAWTPDREDLAEELCGEIEDEDKTLVDRAEERAERFEGYSDRRSAEADSAKQGVDAICEHIPMGQPILIGHHSEKRARKDAEKIENGMRKAVKLWETSQYWNERAAGALRHAKYKELPAVRARRIKTIEADRRREGRAKAKAEQLLKLWSQPDLTAEAAIKFCSLCDAGWLHLPRKEGDRPDFNQNPTAYDALTNRHPTLYAPRTFAEVLAVALRAYPRTIARCERWIQHFDNRLAYEKAMLKEQGASHLIAPTKRPAQLPLLNYRQAVIKAPRWSREEQVFPQVEMTSEDYQNIYSDSRGTLTVNKTHRVRFAFVEMRDGHPARFADHSKGVWSAVFLTDSKTHTPPAVAQQPPAPTVADLEAEGLTTSDAQSMVECAARKQTAAELTQGRTIWNSDGTDGPCLICPPPTTAKPAEPTKAEQFAALKQTLKAGVKVVSAPQLFPTPMHIARRMVELCGSLAGRRVLEPSAGSGNIIRAIQNSTIGADNCQLTAIEINPALAENLRHVRNLTAGANESNFAIRCADFLECVDERKFDAILMNPPFARGADIDHILHARTLLKPNGKLVAICAGGPRQEEKLQPIADTWEPLPSGTFIEQGTMVNTVLLTMSALEEDQPEEKPADPETELRAVWTAKGVPQSRQDEIIAETAAKAQPGAMVGPFVIPHAISTNGPQLELCLA